MDEYPTENYAMYWALGMHTHACFNERLQAWRTHNKLGTTGTGARDVFVTQVLNGAVAAAVLVTLPW